MSSKGLTFLAFIAGAGIGSVCTWQLLKRKYELIAQEEIDSVKAAYAERESGKEFHDGLKVAEDRTPKDVDDMDFKKYASIIQKEGYGWDRSMQTNQGYCFLSHYFSNCKGRRTRQDYGIAVRRR